MNMLYMTQKEVQIKVELVKKYLSEGWSIQVSFRKAEITKKAERFIRPHIQEELKKYKSKYISSSGIETSYV